jgi:hypothetical protein
MNHLSPLRVAALVSVTLLAPAAGAQHSDIEVWSTANDAGALTVTFDFDEEVQVFQNVCAAGRCLYTNTDPGLIGATQDNPGAGLFALADGTRVSFEVVAISSAITVKFGDDLLRQPGAASVIGTAPNLHNHPSWQVLVNQGEVGDFDVSFKLTAETRYAESEVYTLTLTNDPSTPTALVDSPTPSPAIDTPTPTASASATAAETPTSMTDPTATPEATSTEVVEGCTGDCNSDLLVTVDEIVTGINIALGNAAIEACDAFDSSMDGTVTVDEIVSALRGALEGCA